MRRLGMIAWALLIVAVGAILWPMGYSAIFDRDQEIRSVEIGGPFSMTDHNGQAVTEKDFAGKAKVMFFGFTYCPDICPTTLTRLSALLAKLGDDANKIYPLQVSVDPERDTPTVLKSYLAAFDSRIVGLTGTPEQLAALGKFYRVFYEKVTDGTGGYTMNHSAGIFLFDQNGKFKSTIDREESDNVAIAKLKNLIAD